jgi:phage tail sheath protein FI
MAQPIFGLSITQVDNETRPAVEADLSTIGLVVTAPGADAGVYPANTPVLINSADDVALTALGTTGSIANQMELINSQLGGFSASALVVIVRVDAGADDDATMVNLIEGIRALEDAESMLGRAPRLIGVPGYTHQQETPQTGNPVVAALTSTLEKLVGHAVVSGPHDSLQGYTDWRETFSSQRLIPQETWVQVGSPAVVTDSVGGVLGMLVARDNANSGRPFKSAANRPMQGIVNTNRPIPFSTTDGNTEGQLILGLNGGIIVRGEAGSVTSLGSGGFTYVGTDTAAEDDLWRLYNVSRGRDYIHLLFLRTLRFYLGRFNLTGQTIEAILNTMKIALRDLQADGDILGFQVGFEADKNSLGELRLGRFTLNFKAEEAPVLRHLGIESYRYAPAIDALLDDLLSAAA